MRFMEYQTPQLLILLFGQEDVVTASGVTGGENADAFDKAVEDFFGE